MNNEKKKLNKWAIAGIVTIAIILIIIIIFMLIFKRYLNEFDSNNQFSSENVKIQIVDRYNSNLYNNRCGNNDTISYNHKFTEDELNCFTDLIFLDVEVTTDDINQFKNLQKLHISNAKLSNELDLSLNTKLQELTIMYSELLTLNFNQIPNVKKIHLSNTVIKDNKLTINETKLESLEMTRTNIDEITLSNNSSLEEIDIHDSEINKLIFDNNDKIEIDEERYNYLVNNFDNPSDHYTEKMNISKVKNIEFKNFNDIRRLLFSSNINFNSLSYGGKKIYILNEEYFSQKGNKLYDRNIGIENLKVEGLIIKQNKEKTYITEIYDGDIKILEII